MTNRLFPLSRFTIHGNSMLPTLKPGQDVLVFNWAYIFSKPKKGDMVVVQSAKLKVQSEITKQVTDFVIKRVHKVKNNKVYLIGDNENKSTDSRSFGPIDKSEIIGKVIFVR